VFKRLRSVPVDGPTVVGLVRRSATVLLHRDRLLYFSEAGPGPTVIQALVGTLPADADSVEVGTALRAVLAQHQAEVPSHWDPATVGRVLLDATGARGWKEHFRELGAVCVVEDLKRVELRFAVQRHERGANALFDGNYETGMPIQVEARDAGQRLLDALAVSRWLNSTAPRPEPTAAHRLRQARAQ
jgi:hypothetical protein